MRARSKRLVAVGLAASLVIASVALASIALRRHADLFYTPELLLERGQPAPTQRIRIGGFVEQGSLTRMAGAEIRFKVVDGSGEAVWVSYTGITPDLFREGEGVVATGRFANGPAVFMAEEILAKHDETYEPRELRGLSPTQTAS